MLVKLMLVKKIVCLMKRIVCVVLVAGYLSTCAFSAAAESFTPQSFSDTEHHWAKEYIERLAAMGAIKGREDGKFHPNDKITTAEFLAVLLRAVGNDPGQPKEGNWHENYVKEAIARGYVREDETYGATHTYISKAMMARVIARALGKEELAQKLFGQPTAFKDNDSISNYNRGYVRICYEYGIINGTPEGNFMPNSHATRAEAAKMVIMFLDNRDKAVNIPVDETRNPDDLYMYDPFLKKEIKVVTSHPELLPHIRKGMEILSKEGYCEMLYSIKDDVVQFCVYESRKEYEKPIWEKYPFFSFWIYTEKDERNIYLVNGEWRMIYWPYHISLYNTINKTGQMFMREIIRDVFPEAYDKVSAMVEAKIKNPKYAEIIWEKINGREIRMVTYDDANQIDVYLALENE